MIIPTKNVLPCFNNPFLKFLFEVQYHQDNVRRKDLPFKIRWILKLIIIVQANILIEWIESPLIILAYK